MRRQTILGHCWGDFPYSTLESPAVTVRNLEPRLGPPEVERLVEYPMYDHARIEAGSVGAALCLPRLAPAAVATPA